MPPLKYIRGLFCSASATLYSVVLWSLWLALGLLAALQVYIVSTDQLSVPEFALRRVERDLGEAGLQIAFKGTSLDPTGRMLIQDVRISLPEYPDPVLRAGSVDIEFNPWWLTVGVFKPGKIRISDGRVSIPAMLSPSGRSEALIRDLDLTVLPGNNQIDLPQFTARIAGVTVTARGSLAQVRGGPGASRTRSLAEYTSSQFPSWCRQAIAFAGKLEALESPTLDLELSRSDTQVAFVQASLLAKSLSLNAPLPAVARGLQASVRLPLAGESPVSLRLKLQVDDLRLPSHGEARELRASLEGSYQPAALQFTPHSLQLTAGEVDAHGFSARALSASLFSQPLPKVQAELVAEFLGNVLALRGNADLTGGDATLYFRGPISPDIMTPLSAHLRTDVRKYFDFATLDCRDAVAQFGPGWKFQGVRASVVVEGVNAYGVTIDNGYARVELDPGRFYAPEAFGRIGEHYARGSYEQDLRTLEFRFLLAGALRPLGISAWFREWWPNFFGQFQFEAAPPQASVDIAGRWRAGWRSSVFVFADAKNPVIRGAALERVRTRLFIRPTYFDGLELFATHSTGEARGTFNYTVMPETHAWRRLDLEIASTLDPAVAVTIIGPPGERILSQFKYAHPPTLKLNGRMDGAEAPGGAHQTFAIEARTRGQFRFHGFPLEDVSFAAALRDDEIQLQRVEARFAGGTVSGKARVWGDGAARRVGFDTTLTNASLGLVSAAVTQYLAEINNRPADPPGKFVQEKASVLLDLALSAEGRYADPYSFQGSG
ncbi:MAG: hypothetical protein RIQ93_2174, partial [Verrucomicrobiota bacterium]